MFHLHTLVSHCSWIKVFRTRPKSSSAEVFLEKGVLKICCKFTGDHQPWSVILTKLLWNANQLYGNETSEWVFSCKFAAYFQYIFFKNTSGGLLLKTMFIITRLLLPPTLSVFHHIFYDSLRNRSLTSILISSKLIYFYPSLKSSENLLFLCFQEWRWKLIDSLRYA